MAVLRQPFVHLGTTMRKRRRSPWIIRIWAPPGDSAKLRPRPTPHFRKALEDNHIILVGWRDIKKLL
jgi:hypothetical protein